MAIDLDNPPEKYWHCSVKIAGERNPSYVNDLSFSELDKTIVQPWLSGHAFAIAGKVVRTNSAVSEIKVTCTHYPMQHYADQHNAQMREGGIADFATNRRSIPLSVGDDVTNDLLFSGGKCTQYEPDVASVLRLCQRIPFAAKILAVRSRKGKQSYDIDDEYDVQDLLHAVIRAYTKYSVQEDPLPKVAGAKASRADVSIEELGLLIEVKYVRAPDDQKRIFEEYSQDLVLYAQWAHLKTLIYLIYNSGDLREPEAFEKLNGFQEVGGRRFEVKIVLA